MKEKAKIILLALVSGIRRYLNFAAFRRSEGEGSRAEKWRLHVGELKAAVERHGWDG